MVRIIAGKFGSRRLILPKPQLKGKQDKHPSTRPTMDRVREAVFSMLSSIMDLEGARVLDLFSGTGAFGFEALSRGAAAAVFVEQDRLAKKAIEENIQVFGVQGQAEVTSSDVFSYLIQMNSSSGSASNNKFNLIFCDPPYALITAEGMFGKIVSSECMEQGALLVLESKAEEMQRLANLLSSGKEVITKAGLKAELIRSREYGGTGIAIISFL